MEKRSRVTEKPDVREPDFKEYLADLKARIDRRLEELLPPSELRPEIVHEAMRYSVFAGGKRIRPILALETAAALQGNPHATLELACAIEMIHTYSLMHDDLPAMDDDDFRRGKLTAHKKFGEGIAILAGNALLTLAFRILTRLPGAAEASMIEVLERLSWAIGSEEGLIGGQVADLITEGNEFTERDLEYIHSSKTGALIEASTTCAALLSNTEGENLERMSTFGRKIGIAFQIVDDILDVVATSEELGKTSGKDARGKKATYPALFGLEESRKKASVLVSEAIEEISFLGERATNLSELANFISVRRF